jgi:hypothetical protein
MYLFILACFFPKSSSQIYFHGKFSKNHKFKYVYLKVYECLGMAWTYVFQTRAAVSFCIILISLSYTGKVYWMKVLIAIKLSYCK